MASKNVEKPIYLIGHQRQFLNQRKLSSNLEVLSVLFYKYRAQGKSMRQSAGEVITEVENVWKKTGIPVMESRNSIPKLENLFSKWKNLNKSHSRKNSITQKSKEQNFKFLLNKLFDISSRSKAITLKEEQRLFLESERKNKRRSIIPFDLDETSIDLNESVEGNLFLSMSYAVLFYIGQLISEISKTFSNCSVSNELLSDYSEGSSSNLKRIPSNFEDELPANSKVAKLNIITPEVVAALDRTNTTDRNATIIVAAVTQSLGIDINDVNLCPSTIHRQRIKARKNIAETLKKNFSTPENLTVHWDVKLLPEITGPAKVERLPIVVTGLNCEQLLGVPKLEKSTGENQATVIIDILRQWNLTDCVRALCFDTTSVNTGKIIFLLLRI